MLGQSPLRLIWLETTLPLCQFLVIHAAKLSPVECLKLICVLRLRCLGEQTLWNNDRASVIIKWTGRFIKHKCEVA